jgi:uncharacterized protein (DUF433 family)
VNASYDLIHYNNGSDRNLGGFGNVIECHRIGIETVLFEYLHRERTAEEIQALYPTLTLAEVYVTILYYLQNSETVSQYLEDWLAWSHQQRKQQAANPHPAAARLRRLKAEQSLAMSA